MRPSAGIDASGNFVIAWQSQGQDGDNYGVYAQRYDATGAAQGSEFQVNTFTTSIQGDPSVGMDASGNFVIAWSSTRQDGDSDGAGTSVYAQRYDVSGKPQGSEFRVNTYTKDAQLRPSVGMIASGNFVVAWESFGQDGDEGGIFAQRYDATGKPQGSEFQVNTYAKGQQGWCSAGMAASGNFVVAWECFGQDGHEGGIYAQRYDATGKPQGSEFQVNTYSPEYLWFPSFGMAASGNFVIAWSDMKQSGDGTDIFARLFLADEPPATDGSTEQAGKTAQQLDASEQSGRFSLRLEDGKLIEEHTNAIVVSWDGDPSYQLYALSPSTHFLAWTENDWEELSDLYLLDLVTHERKVIFAPCRNPADCPGSQEDATRGYEWSPWRVLWLDDSTLLYSVRFAFGTVTRSCSFLRAYDVKTGKHTKVLDVPRNAGLREGISDVSVKEGRLVIVVGEYDAQVLNFTLIGEAVIPVETVLERIGDGVPLAWDELRTPPFFKAYDRDQRLSESL